jgi:hypothetical protein
VSSNLFCDITALCVTLQDIYFMIWVLFNQLCVCVTFDFGRGWNNSSNKLLYRLVNLNHHTNRTIFLLLWPIRIAISSHWLTAQIVLCLLFDRGFVKVRGMSSILIKYRFFLTTLAIVLATWLCWLVVIAYIEYKIYCHLFYSYLKNK